MKKTLPLIQKTLLCGVIATIFTCNFISAQRSSNLMPASTIKIQGIIGYPGQTPLGIMAASLPHEELLKTTTFFKGDSLSGFSYETIAKQLEKDGYKLLGEFSAMMYRAQKDFVKNKYNVPSFTNEFTAKKYTPPVPLVSSCDNLDFEDGNFNTWIITSGINQNSNGNLTLLGSGFSSTDQNVYSCNDVNLITGTYGNDPIGFPGLYPSGGSYSARIGGFNINASDGYGFGCAGSHWTNLSYANGEVIEKSYTVTTANDLLSYNYAVVLNDGGHPYGSQPYFHVYVKDLAGNILTSCTQYYVQAATGIPPAGFSNSGFVNTFDNSIFYYKNWTSSSINLSAYIGQTVKVSFVTAGCTAGAHPGWAYVDATCASAQIISSNNSSNLPCAGSTITLTAPAVQGGSYSWSGPGITGPTNGQSVTVNMSGTYSVTVIPPQGSACAYTLSIPVTFNTPVIATTTSTPAGCSINNGTATVNASGGTPNYTYLWTPGGQTSQTSTGLSSGNYNVTVSDANGCTNTVTISVTSANGPTVTVSTLNNVSCNGGNNGSATATASGGTPNYTYQWSNGQTTSTATGLTAGTYIVTVTDANNCSFVTTISVTQPNILAVVTTQNNISCNGGNNGSATATPSGGTPGYTYTWSNGQTTSIATGLSAATYSVTVMDAHSCTQTAIVTITQPTSLTVSAGSNQNINSGQNVTMIASVSGGTPSYNYLWSNSATTQSITANPSATITFSVTVTDAHGCSANSAVTIFVNIIPVTPTFSCSVSSYTTTDSVVWFSFVAASPYTQITVASPPLGGSSPHIHELTLYSGNTILEDENFPLVHGAQEIEIDASGLTVGATYHLKASRSPGGLVCPSVTIPGAVCGCTSSATFSLAIRSLNVIATKDFGLEPPAISHAYYTNKGQIVDLNQTPRFDIKAYTANVSPAVYNSDTVTSFVFAHIDTIASTPDTLERVDMSLVGASPSCGHAFKTEKISSYLNYFLGHVPTGATSIKGYNRTVKNDVYRNIDMQLYSNSAGVKFYFVVRPGGNLDTIVLNFSGANTVQVTGSGGLQIITLRDTLNFEAPHAYQLNTSNQVVPVSGAQFVQLSSTSVKLSALTYTLSKPLFVQVDRGHIPTPSTTTDWSTYLGGNGNDVGMDVKTDGSGNVYFCGSAGSTNFPNVTGGVYTANAGNDDAFIEKFNPQGIPVFGTYFGGSSNEACFGLARNSTGDIYIVGNTLSNNLPLVPSANSALQGIDDAFIARFNSTGSSLLFSRYFGGNNSFTTEQARSVAVDGLDNVYMVGETVTPSGNNFPLVPKTGAYNQSGSAASPGYPDAFIAEFNSSNTQIWGTYFGGGGADYLTKVIIGQNNSILLSGSTESNTPASANPSNTPCAVPGSTNEFPDCNPGGGAYTQVPKCYSGSADAIIVEFDQNGSLTWSTYFGGQGQETAGGAYWYSTGAITIDPTNPNILYIIGRTSKFDNPLFTFTSQEYGQSQAWIGSNNRAFIAKFNSKVLQWSTIFGPGSGTEGTGVTMDNSSNVFMTGTTQNNSYTNSSFACQTAQNELTEFPQCDPGIFFQSTYGGGSNGDSYISGFNSSDKLIWSTYYGGSSGDEGRAITFDPIFRRIYITGRTQSTGLFPLKNPNTGNYQQNVCAGGMDAYIGRFDLPLIFSVNDLSNFQGQIGVYPNPTTKNISININTKDRGILKIRIYNALGALIAEKNEKINSSDDIYNIDVSTMTPGIYFIKANINSDSFSAKFIKQ